MYVRLYDLNQMKLLQPKEREIVFNRQNNLNRRKAAELSLEADERVKAFNELQENLVSSEKLLRKEHDELKKKLKKEEESLLKTNNELKHKCEVALEPLYEKERLLERKSGDLQEREYNVSHKEKLIAIKEEDIMKLELTCNNVIQDIQKREKENIRKEQEIQQRTLHLSSAIQREKKFIKEEKAELRLWLEGERKKLRK